MKLVTLIVPCYNEEAVLPLFDRELHKIMEQLSDYSFELLYINDGSKDDTLSVMKRLALED